MSAKLIIGSALVFLFIGTPPIFSQARIKSQQQVAKESLPDIIERVNQSILRISVRVTFVNAQTKKQEKQQFWGTGFIINSRGQIATAKHVVELEAISKAITDSGRLVQAKSLRMESLRVVWVLPNRETAEGKTEMFNVQASYAATIFRVDPAADAAILDCERNFLVPLDVPMFNVGTFTDKPLQLPHFRIEPLRAGEQISVTGFPKTDEFGEGVPGFVTDSGTIASSGLVVGTKHVYYGELHISHGNSGGPIFSNATGEIIGLLQGYNSDANSIAKYGKLAIIVPIRQVLQLAQ